MDYLSTCIDQVQTFGDILQLVIVELIYKVKGKCCGTFKINAHVDLQNYIRLVLKRDRMSLEKEFDWLLVYVRNMSLLNRAE